MARESVFITLGILFIVECHWSRGVSGAYGTLTTDACRNSGTELVCGQDNVLHISDVRCLPYNYTCPENDRIVSLCSGQKSCSTIGLRQQLHYYCKSEPPRTVVISFSCIPGPDPPCRTNICSNESQGLLCDNDHVIHILKATCSHGQQDCPWRAYHTLYTSCEGHSRCAASGLRKLVPKSTCDHRFLQGSNIFVDYICVTESIFDDSCNGDFKRMAPKFGIIKSPGFPQVGSNHKTACNWELSAGVGQEILVTVHMSYSRAAKRDCRSLQVQYITCRTFEKKTQSLCRMQNINVKMLSCGTVYIMNRANTENSATQYLISYQVRHSGATGDTFFLYRSTCAFNSTISNDDNTISSEVPSLTIDHNTENGLYSNPSQADRKSMSGGSTNKSKIKSSFDPDRWTTVFKIVVINVFLFIIIIALLLALIYICVKYRKGDKYKFSSRRKGQTKRDDSTQLRNLCNSSNEDEGINEGFTTPRTTFSQSEITATIHSEPPYASVSGDRSHSDSGYITVTRIDSSERRGVSSFMQPKGSNTTSPNNTYSGNDPYASYSSLNDTYEVIPSNQRTQDIRSAPPQVISPEVHDLPLPPPPPPLIQNTDRVESPTLSDDIEHYTINEDDYAIVRKPKRKNTENRESARLSDMLKEYEINPEAAGVVSSSSARPPVKQRPPYPHLHRDGFLPAHRCLLEPNSPCSHVGNGRVSAHPSYKKGETMI